MKKIILLSLLLFINCSSITRRDYTGELKEGMPKVVVIELLGKPDCVDYLVKETSFGKKELWIYFYKLYNLDQTLSYWCGNPPPWSWYRDINPPNHYWLYFDKNGLIYWSVQWRNLEKLGFNNYKYIYNCKKLGRRFKY